MTVLIEPNHAAEFLMSEANGYRSRGEGVLASGNNLVAGSIVQLTGGEYVPVVDLDTDPVAVQYASYDATSADVEGTFIVRDAEVIRARLAFPSGFNGTQETAAVARLVAEGIKVV